MADAAQTKKPISGTTGTTPTFRVSYPSLFKAKRNTRNGKDEYSVEALFELGADLSDLKQMAHNACVKTWGDDPTKWPKDKETGKIRTPFKDQGSKEKDGKLGMGLTKGAIFMTFKADASKSRPAVVDVNRQEILEEHKIYAGCYARASVVAYAYPKKGVVGQSPGVAFGLNAIQFVKDGEAFSSRPSVEDAFEPMADTTEGKDASSLF